MREGEIRKMMVGIISDICGSAEGAGWWWVVDHGGVISGLGFCVGSDGWCSTIPEEPQNYLTLVRNLNRVAHHLSIFRHKPITQHNSRPLVRSVFYGVDIHVNIFKTGIRT